MFSGHGNRCDRPVTTGTGLFGNPDNYLQCSILRKDIRLMDDDTCRDRNGWIALGLVVVALVLGMLAR